MVVAPEEKIPAAPGYHEIKGHWAENDILELINDEVVSGYSDGTIKPDGAITRAEMAKIIVTALKLKASNTNLNHYKDAGEFPEWSIPYINTAFESGFMIGYNDDSFKASKFISREEAAIVLMRAFGFGESQNTKLSFVDAGQIHNWALAYVVKAIELKIVKGYPENMFYPLREVTRAEAFVLINRSRKLNK